MSWELASLSEDALVRWIEDSLATGKHRLAKGYQGQTLLYAEDNLRLVIKTPAGRGFVRWVTTRMLRHEARVYESLRGFPAIPHCYGLLRERYLVLGFVDGVSMRHAEIEDREAFFAELLRQIENLHARGIAHSDLQKKDNLLVVAGKHPCLLDFGAAVMCKPGFAPFNHFHYRFAQRLDFNQWAKLKYQGRIEQMSDADRRYYRRSAIEKLARSLKRVSRKIRNLLMPAAPGRRP
jgi:predicted Ser/Thr protein kinase